jgi:hypothetical protein
MSRVARNEGLLVFGQPQHQESAVLQREVNALTKEVDKLSGELAMLRPHREYHDTRSAGFILGLSIYQVAKYCREGSIIARKRNIVRGKALEWSIEHSEVIRFLREGKYVSSE